MTYAGFPRWKRIARCKLSSVCPLGFHLSRDRSVAASRILAYCCCCMLSLSKLAFYFRGCVLLVLVIVSVAETAKTESAVEVFAAHPPPPTAACSCDARALQPRCTALHCILQLLGLPSPLSTLIPVALAPCPASSLSLFSSPPP